MEYSSKSQESIQFWSQFDQIKNIQIHSPQNPLFNFPLAEIQSNLNRYFLRCLIEVIETNKAKILCEELKQQITNNTKLIVFKPETKIVQRNCRFLSVPESLQQSINNSFDIEFEIIHEMQNNIKIQYKFQYKLTPNQAAISKFTLLDLLSHSFSEEQVNQLLGVYMIRPVTETILQEISEDSLMLNVVGERCVNGSENSQNQDEQMSHLQSLSYEANHEDQNIGLYDFNQQKQSIDSQLKMWRYFINSSEINCLPNQYRLLKFLKFILKNLQVFSPNTNSFTNLQYLIKGLYLKGKFPYIRQMFSELFSLVDQIIKKTEVKEFIIQENINTQMNVDDILYMNYVYTSRQIQSKNYKQIREEVKNKRQEDSGWAIIYSLADQFIALELPWSAQSAND